VRSNSSFQYTVVVTPPFLFVGSGAEEEDSRSGSGSAAVTSGPGGEKLDPLSGKQRHQLKHRELFLSRQVETLPATHIRGKCSVTLLNETESLLSYLNKDVSSTNFLNWNFLFSKISLPIFNF
jgi:hypothetical protein